MPISLLTSPPGTGKTLKSVEIIFQKLAEGYIVYSNIIGLKIPGVLPLEFNADWRDLDDFKRHMPEHSDKPIFVVIDECHEWYAFGSHFNKTKIKELTDDATSNKRNQFNLLKAAQQKFTDIISKIRGEESKTILDSDVEEPFYMSPEDYSFYEEQRSALSMHRHFGFDFLLVTQEVSKLNKTVRDFVSLHMHMRRPFNMPYATIFHFREAQDNIGLLTYRQAERKERFKYPKWLFNFYTSTNINSIKSNYPWFWICFLVVVFCALIWVAYRILGVGLFNSNTEVQAQSSVESVQPVTASASIDSSFSKGSVVTTQSVEYQERVRPAMVIESSSECRVFNSSGDRIVTDDATCKNLSSRTTNMTFSKTDRSTIHSHSNIENNRSESNSHTSNYNHDSLYNDKKTYS